MSSSPTRILSVDVLRGLVVTLMIFVNDLANSVQAPSWLKHFAADGDGMSFADLVFPAFLFIAGMSIPLSLGKAHLPEAPKAALLTKILYRGFALLTMGVIMVNAEQHEPWVRGLWGICAYLAMFLCFRVPPRSSGPQGWATRLMPWMGGVALLTLALLYRDAQGQALLLGPLFNPTDSVWLRHSWWGILGLIGWAYMVAACVYVFFGYRREWLLGAAGLLTLLFLTAQADLPAHLAGRPWLNWAAPLLTLLQAPFAWINVHIGFGTTLGPLAGLTVAGSCLGSVIAGPAAMPAAGERIRWALLFAGGLFLAGLLLDAPHGLNKTRATPAFCLYCASLTTLGWVTLHWLIDLKGKQSLLRVVGPAGENPLLAYMLHPFLCMLVALTGEGSEAVVYFYRNLSAWPTCLGSLLVALLIVHGTGAVARSGYRLKV